MCIRERETHRLKQEKWPEPAKVDDRFEVFKNFKVGANGSLIELETLKITPEVIKTLGASISIE